MTHIELFRRIDDHFLREQSLVRVRSFLNSQRQVEGWFKGELILFLSTLHQQNELTGWRSEYRTPEIGERRIDFQVLLDDGPLYFEIKSFYHGRQGAVMVDLATCLTFLPNDIGKLSLLENGNKFCLVFLTPRPDPERWQNALQRFRRNFPCLAEVRTRDEFPEEMYIAKLEVTPCGNGG